MVCVSGAGAAASVPPLDAPSLASLVSGHGKVELVVTAGSTGTPGGFTLVWATREDFEANGNAWPLPQGDAVQAYFWGEPTLNDFRGEPGTFLLGPGESITIQPGDIADESGVTADHAEELAYGTEYVFTVFANADFGWARSGYSNNIVSMTTGASGNCTYTIGYEKNHPESWAVLALMLGTVTYDQPELLAILHQPVAGNGLVSLAHQLIAAKLNVAKGADDADIAPTIANADALIGASIVPPIGAGRIHPSQTAGLTEMLDDYNNGIIGPGHCPTGACCVPDQGCVVLTEQRCHDLDGVFLSSDEPCLPEICAPSPTLESSWGRIKVSYR